MEDQWGRHRIVLEGIDLENHDVVIARRHELANGYLKEGACPLHGDRTRLTGLPRNAPEPIAISCSQLTGRTCVSMCKH